MVAWGRGKGNWKGYYLMSTASICKIMIKYFPKYYETLQNNDNDHSNFEPLLLWDWISWHSKCLEKNL